MELAALALAACSSNASPPCGVSCDGAFADAAVIAPQQTCVATFSGGVTATDPACAMTVTYTTTTNSFTLSTQGNIVPMTSDTWSGVRVTQPGEPDEGPISMPLATKMQLVDLSDSSAPLWAESSAQSLGSFAAQLDDLGPSIEVVSGDLLYSTPHGRVDAVLVDTTGNAAPDVALTVTF